MTGSTIDEKDMIGQQLFELGDLTRDLYDDVRSINNKAVDAFTWVQWDVSPPLSSAHLALCFASAAIPPRAPLDRRQHAPKTPS